MLPEHLTINYKKKKTTLWKVLPLTITKESYYDGKVWHNLHSGEVDVSFNQIPPITPVIHLFNKTYGFQLYHIDPIQARIIKEIMGNQYMTSDDYKARRDSRPFLQGFEETNLGEWVYVEFWTDNLYNIQKFCDYITSQVNDPRRYKTTKEVWSTL